MTAPQPLLLNLCVIKHSGRPALMFRKIVTLCDKNLPFFEKVIAASFLDQKLNVTAQVSIQFVDKFRAIQRLRELGVEINIPVDALRKSGKRT